MRAQADSKSTAQTVIDEAEVRGNLSASSVDGLLENSAGVDFVRRDSGGSQNSRIRLRGMDESRLLILLNGRKLNGAGVCGGYYVDWTSLSLENVERLVLYRGAAPAKYGNNLGGVLNIITREGSTDFHGFLRMTGGSDGTWSAQLSQSFGIGPVLFNVYARHYETEGNLRNGFAQNESIGGGLTLLLPKKFKLSTNGRYSYSQSGMPVYNMPDSPYYDSQLPDSIEARLGGPGVNFLNHGAQKWGPLDWGDGSDIRDHRGHFDVALTRKTEPFDMEIRGWMMEQRRKDRFYAIEDSRHLVFSREAAPEKHNWGWQFDLRNMFDFAGSHIVEYGGGGTYLGYGDILVKHVDETFFSPGAIPEDSDGKTTVSMLHGVYLQDIWKIHQRFTLELGLRFDMWRADGPTEDTKVVKENALGPRGAITVRTWPGGQINARYRYASRFPGLPEYYWWFGGYQPEHRKDLSAENAHQVEVEVKHAFADKTMVVARGYYYAVSDYIRTIFGYRPSRVIYNIDKVHFAGFELEGTYDLPHHLYAWGNYTFQVTKKTGDVLDNSTALSDELVELPKHKINFGFGYDDRDGLQAQLTVRFVGLRHAIIGDLTAAGGSRMEPMDSFWKLDINASYPVIRQTETGRNVRVEVSLDNLLNQDWLEEYGYPMPGLVFMAGMRATL
ncbi:MAG: TonB-dependent receptor [Deltaproteobacteria bacterium]|nr:TonB-dependent receptor [Deltaproteobacteria bacterium]